MSKSLEFKRYMRRNWQYYVLLLVPVIYYIIFRYVPMAGNIIAFRRYRAGHSIFGDEWSGLKYFKQFIGDKTFWRAFRNTLSLNIISRTAASTCVRTCARTAVST